MADETKVPDELKYTKEHEWVRMEGELAVVGVTDYAQKELGDIVFVELPKPGTPVTQMQALGSIESVKAANELFSPLTGEAVERNEALENAPEAVNKDPYGEGWMVKIKTSKPEEMDQLLDAAAYREFLGTL